MIKGSKSKESKPKSSKTMALCALLSGFSFGLKKAKALQTKTSVILALLFFPALSHAMYCVSGADGAVSCSQWAQYCLTSQTGEVACGGMAQYCEESPTGKVACGGMAQYCLESSTGEVACGGMALYCITGRTGKTACGAN